VLLNGETSMVDINTTALPTTLPTILPTTLPTTLPCPQGLDYFRKLLRLLKLIHVSKILLIIIIIIMSIIIIFTCCRRDTNKRVQGARLELSEFEGAGDFEIGEDNDSNDETL
jgi:hypothetical protein